jgi:hypothetical protein
MMMLAVVHNLVFRFIGDQNFRSYKNSLQGDIFTPKKET